MKNEGSGLTQPLADDLRHTVALHGHAVERVGDLHRALLVRDDDQLRGLLQLLHDPDQPLQVGVVERRLDLVHHVERTRPGLEDRHQHRHRGQRALPAGEQRQPLDLLARGPGLDVHARGEHVVGVGQDQPSLTAREQPAEDALELPGGVPEGLGEDLLDALVDLLDDLEQVGAGLLQVLQLLAEELVPLLQRRELLQRQRVDLAELLVGALGGLQPLLLLGADEGARAVARVLRVFREHLAVGGGEGGTS